MPIGEIAALFTSFCWALSAVGFSKSTQKVGSQVTNRVRVVIAMVVLILINAILYGQPIPLHAGASRWAWLGISGIIGLSLGDAFLFQAYVEIGPRLGLLLLSLAPVFGATIAWIFFGQNSHIDSDYWYRNYAWRHFLGDYGSAKWGGQKWLQGERSRGPFRGIGSARTGYRLGSFPAGNDGWLFSLCRHPDPHVCRSRNPLDRCFLPASGCLHGHI